MALLPQSSIQKYCNSNMSQTPGDQESQNIAYPVTQSGSWKSTKFEDVMDRLQLKNLQDYKESRIEYLWDSEHPRGNGGPGQKQS
jgi:hypothetical protein